MRATIWKCDYCGLEKVSARPETEAPDRWWSFRSGEKMFCSSECFEKWLTDTPKENETPA